MGLPDLVAGKGHGHAVVQPGQLEIPPRAAGRVKGQPHGPVAGDLAGAVVIHGIGGAAGGSQQLPGRAVPLDQHIAGPVAGGFVKMQSQTRRTVFLGEGDFQHRRGGKAPVAAALLLAPQAPELARRLLGEQFKTAVHQKLTGLQGTVFGLVRALFQQQIGGQVAEGLGRLAGGGGIPPGRHVEQAELHPGTGSHSITSLGAGGRLGREGHSQVLPKVSGSLFE